MLDILKDLHADSQKLRSVDMVANGNVHKIYYKLLTGQDLDGIRTLAKRIKTVEGKEIEYVDEDLLRVHVIIRQALNEAGEHLFTIIDEDNIKKIPYENQCYLASVMGLKSLSDMVEEATEALKKTSSQGL